MPIFGEATSPYDELVEKVTAETLTSENWALMMDISDDVANKGPKACKLCLVSIKKRLNHRDPHVVLLGLSLLDCLWNNCGSAFRREVSSKEFINELHYKATSSNRVIGEKTRELIKKWSCNECKKDSSLSLVESLYKDLLDDGWTFEQNPNSIQKKIIISNDPNVVSTEEEEADIAKAIALSLSEANDKSKNRSSVMYPSSFEGTAINLSQAANTQRQVKALYDFEAVEDNEISFAAGEMITVLDDSDQNWWRGSTARATGLFPASFVTFDLKTDITDEKNDGNTNKEESRQQALQQEIAKVEINEDTLLKCFQLLQDCDPTGEVPDSPELAYYEQMSLAQAALIDQRLAQIDKQHNMLAQTDVAIRDVLANYDNAVQQVHYQVQSTYTSSPMMGVGASSLPPGSTMASASASMNNVMASASMNPAMASASINTFASGNVITSSTSSTGTTLQSPSTQVQATPGQYAPVAQPPVSSIPQPQLQQQQYAGTMQASLPPL